jgi:hypothetical protein
MMSHEYGPPFVTDWTVAERLEVPGRLRCGRTEVELPIRYCGVRTVLVTIPARRSDLQALLPDGVRARRLREDDGALVIQFVDMPTTTIGAYRECAISVVVNDTYDWPAAEDAEWRPPPCYALWLSVTTEAARESGQAIWGYPKEVAPTEFDITSDRFQGNVALSGGGRIRATGLFPTSSERGRVQMRVVTGGAGVPLRRSVIEGIGKIALAGESAPRLQIELTPGHAVTNVLQRIRWSLEDAEIISIDDYEYALDAPLSEDAHA